MLKNEGLFVCEKNQAFQKPSMDHSCSLVTFVCLFTVRKPIDDSYHH